MPLKKFTLRYKKLREFFEKESTSTLGQLAQNFSIAHRQPSNQLKDLGELDTKLSLRITDKVIISKIN